ncbi:hypothetical protein B484DRAFT_438792, partial [Ochromonadaceae sp. CCMP2298]
MFLKQLLLLVLSACAVVESTPAPTRAPTYSPTLAVTDCTYLCSWLTDGATAPVSANNLFKRVTLSSGFFLVFDIITGSLPSSSNYQNIVDLVDEGTGSSLFAVSRPWSKSTSFYFEGSQKVQWGPELDADYQSIYTTVTVAYYGTYIWYFTSKNTQWVASYSVSAVSTAGKTYSLYLSNNAIASAGGTIKNIWLGT